MRTVLNIAFSRGGESKENRNAVIDDALYNGMGILAGKAQEQSDFPFVDYAQQSFTGLYYKKDDKGEPKEATFFWYLHKSDASSEEDKPTKVAYLTYRFKDQGDRQAFLKRRFAGLTIKGGDLEVLKAASTREKVRDYMKKEPDFLAHFSYVFDPSNVLGSQSDRRKVFFILDRLMAKLIEHGKTHAAPKPLVIINQAKSNDSFVEDESKLTVKDYLYTVLALLPIELANSISFADNMRFDNYEATGGVADPINFVFACSSTQDRKSKEQIACPGYSGNDFDVINLADIGRDVIGESYEYKSAYVKCLFEFFNEEFQNQEASQPKATDFFSWMWSTEKNEFGIDVCCADGIKLTDDVAKSKIPYLYTVEGLDEYGRECLVRKGKMLDWLIRLGKISQSIHNTDDLIKWKKAFDEFDLYSAELRNDFKNQLIKAVSSGELKNDIEEIGREIGNNDIRNLKTYISKFDEIKDLADKLKFSVNEKAYIHYDKWVAMTQLSKKQEIGTSFADLWVKAEWKCLYTQKQEDKIKKNATKRAKIEMALDKKLQDRDNRLNKAYIEDSKDLLKSKEQSENWLGFFSLLFTVFAMLVVFIDNYLWTWGTMPWDRLFGLLFTMMDWFKYLLYAMAAVPLILMGAFYASDIAKMSNNMRLQPAYAFPHACWRACLIAISYIASRELVFFVLNVILIGG